MKRLAIFFVLSLLLIAGSTSSVLAQENTQESETYILLYDESHEQYFTSDLMSTAFSELNSTYDNSDVDVTVELIKQKDNFNSTNLQGVDLVMITNPGTDENGDVAEVGNNEVTALRNLVDIGGSVFYLSNPLSYDKNVTGHGDPLNDLIFQGFGAEIETAASGDTDNTTVIVDNFNYENNNTFIEVDSDQFNDETITTQVNNITKENDASFLYYGAQLRESNNAPGPIAASASSTAFVYDKNFDITFYQESPRWLYGTEIGENGGRGMLAGSTVMFSDYAFGTNSTWIEQRNNQDLFENLIGWLLGITPLPEDQSIVEESFNPFFIRINLLYAVIIGFAFFAGTAFVFMRSGRLSPSNIFDIFTEKDSSQKSSSKNKSSSKSKSSSSSRSKRRKRT